MSRKALGIDRLAALVVGILALAVGLAGIAWSTGLLDRWVSGVGNSYNLHTVDDHVFATAWWPWAAGFGGVVIAALGLWWLLGHFKTHRVRALTLPGSGPSGTLRADTSAVTAAAGEVLAINRGVRTASGYVGTDRHQLVLDLDTVVEPGIDLDLLSRAVQRTAGQVADVTGIEGLYARGRVTVAGHSREKEPARTVR